MKQPEDLVWDAITESAKRKFDYAKYRAELGTMADDNIVDNIIIIIIAGHLSGRSDQEIAQIVNQDLPLLGIAFQTGYLETFLKDKKSTFADEIHAADIALTLLDQGSSVPGVLVQVKSMLNMF